MSEANKEYFERVLQSNDYQEIAEALSALLAAAQLNKEWALQYLEAGIRKRAGRNDIQFYRPLPSMLPSLVEVNNLGTLLNADLLLNDVAYTQSLIFHTQDHTDLLEDYFRNSRNENQNRIIYSLLHVQMQISKLLGKYEQQSAAVNIPQDNDFRTTYSNVKAGLEGLKAGKASESQNAIEGETTTGKKIFRTIGFLLFIGGISVLLPLIPVGLFVIADSTSSIGLIVGIILVIIICFVMAAAGLLLIIKTRTKKASAQQSIAEAASSVYKPASSWSEGYLEQNIKDLPEREAAQEWMDQLTGKK